MSRLSDRQHRVARIVGAIVLIVLVYLSGLLWYGAETTIEHLFFLVLGVLAGVLFFIFGGDLWEWIWWWT